MTLTDAAPQAPVRAPLEQDESLAPIGGPDGPPNRRPHHRALALVDWSCRAMLASLGLAIGSVALLGTVAFLVLIVVDGALMLIEPSLVADVLRGPGVILCAAMLGLVLVAESWVFLLAAGGHRWSVAVSALAGACLLLALLPLRGLLPPGGWAALVPVLAVAQPFLAVTHRAARRRRRT